MNSQLKQPLVLTAIGATLAVAVANVYKENKNK